MDKRLIEIQNEYSDIMESTVMSRQEKGQALTKLVFAMEREFKIPALPSKRWESVNTPIMALYNAVSQSCEMAGTEIFPEKEPQKVNPKWFRALRPEKIELLDGVIWGDNRTETEQFTLMLIYNMGLGRLIELLPDESRETLRELLDWAD